MRLKPMNFAGKWVLVSGASSGLGEAIARELALKHQANLIIVARRRPQLETLKAQLEAQARVQVEVIAADLCDFHEADRVIRETLQGRTLYAAILNAGVTHFGEHSQLEWDQFEKMLRLNVSSVVRMAQPLIDHLSSNGLHGGMMIVSSMAGMIPIPYQAAYSGTKAFLLNFGSALAEEVSEKGVSVSTFAPGGIQTEMTSTESFQKLSRWLMPVEQVAREAIQGFRLRKKVYVPGTGNRVGAYLAGLLPRDLLVSRIGATYRGALKKTKPAP
jgi:short-subunit dehydrogenase